MSSIYGLELWRLLKSAWLSWARRVVFMEKGVCDEPASIHNTTNLFLFQQGWRGLESTRSLVQQLSLLMSLLDLWMSWVSTYYSSTADFCNVQCLASLCVVVSTSNPCLAAVFFWGSGSGEDGFFDILLTVDFSQRCLLNAVYFGTDSGTSAYYLLGLFLCC